MLTGKCKQPCNTVRKAFQVKKRSAHPRASHVNSGTSVPHDELPWPDGWPMRDRPVIGNPKLQAQTDEDAPITAYGGVMLAADFLRRFGVAKRLDRAVELLKQHNPYHESDHIIAQAMNLYVGGTCLEDMAKLQGDEGVLRMLKACRLPDPTTGGDFLRRFDQASLGALRRVNDGLQDDVWKVIGRKQTGRRKRKRDLAVVDMDGHFKELYGVQKEGADFSRKGQWSYHPLVFSLAGVGETVAVRNRPGNVQSFEGADEEIDCCAPRLHERFRNVLFRGDSDFDRSVVREACERNKAYFAFVSRQWSDRPQMAMKVPDFAWKPYRSKSQRERDAHRARKEVRRRKRKRNNKRRRARQRGYTDLSLVTQWVAEVPYTSPGTDKTYRLVIRKQLLEEECGKPGQRELWQRYRYRWVITNLPRSYNAQEVIDETYQRCDQENFIEQMGSGLAMWRMPVREFDGNCAWLEIARLAWNLGKWLAQLALPDEVVRWEWKRFRLAFVYIAAKVVHRARQVLVRLAGSHRFSAPILEAHVKLQV